MKEPKEKPNYTSIGGQALIEGIMMRGPKRTAMAVRDPDGKIVLEIFPTAVHDDKLHKTPFVRGIFNFVDSMKVGYKCLMRSAEISMPEEAEKRRTRRKRKRTAS